MLPKHEENTVKKTVIFATAFALAFGPAVSFAASLKCNGFTVIGNSETTTTAAQSDMATQFTKIMVCDPSSGAPWHAQEFHGGGATTGNITEYSDQARNPYATYTLGGTGTGGGSSPTIRGTIYYTYNGSNTPTYMVSVNGTTMYFCNSGTSNGDQDNPKYTTTWKAESGVTSCSAL
jgi:hypothetical protein